MSPLQSSWSSIGSGSSNCEKYWAKWEQFDKYLSNQKDSFKETTFPAKENKASFRCVCFLVIIVIYNITTAVLYYNILSPNEVVMWETIYFYHFGYLIFMAATFNITIRLYGFGVRIEIFIGILNGIFGSLSGKRVKKSRRRLLHSFVKTSCIKEWNSEPPDREIECNLVKCNK